MIEPPVHVCTSKFPVDATVTLVKSGNKGRQPTSTAGSATRALRITDADEAEKFKLPIWG